MTVKNRNNMNKEKSNDELFIKNYKSTSSFLSGLMIMFSDYIALMLSIGFSFFFINLLYPEGINFRSFIWYTTYSPMMLIIYYAAGLYPGIMTSPSEEVKKLFICNSLCLLGLSVTILIEFGQFNALTNFIDPTKFIKSGERRGVICALLLSIPVSAIVHPATRELARHIFGKFSWWGVPAILYDTNGSSFEVCKRLLTRKHLGYKPFLIITDSPNNIKEFMKIPVITDSSEVLEEIKKLKIKVAILCDYAGDRKKIFNYYRYTIYVTQAKNTITTSLQLKDIGGILGFSSTHNLTRKINLVIKRFIDISIIVISSPVVIPVMIFLSLCVKLSSKGPVFYGHKRVGKNGKEIKCWKFRSMYKDSQKMLEEILLTNPEMKKEWEENRKFVNDPRVTKFGKFLRKTSLDELPQLFNILIGNMSFVGPRPVTKDELEKYGENANYILTVTPGLSGMWQISGRSDTGYEERINLDSYYIQNWSIWLDMWIIIKTVWVVLRGKGAY